MDQETQKLVEEAVAKARAEALAEFKAAKSSLEAWVEKHPVLAFRVGVIAGVIGGGFTVYGVLRVLG